MVFTSPEVSEKLSLKLDIQPIKAKDGFFYYIG